MFGFFLYVGKRRLNKPCEALRYSFVHLMLEIPSFPALVGQSADPWVNFIVGCKSIKHSELFVYLDILKKLQNTTENQYCENTSASLPFLKYLASQSFRNFVWAFCLFCFGVMFCFGWVGCLGFFFLLCWLVLGKLV